MIPRSRPSLPTLLMVKKLFGQKQRRNITSIATSDLTTVLQSAYCSLPTRRLLAISGPDSTRYLQGAVTINLINPSNLARHKGFYAAFLTAQGKLLNDVFIYPFSEVQGRFKGEQGWLIEIDTNEVEHLAQRIKRYQLNAKFEVRVLPISERTVWSFWHGSESESRPSHLLTPNDYKSQANDAISCRDTRAPGMGYRLLLSGDQKPELEMEESNEECYRLRRYLNGVPEGQREILKENSFPLESNIDYMGGIDYQKGCYIGQELTIRTHHRGVVRKRILPLQIYSTSDKAPSNLSFQSNSKLEAEKIPLNTSIGRWEKSRRRTGKWLAGLGNIGLGLCRLESMTSVAGDGMVGCYEAGDEFKMEWESDGGNKIIKVKAFVPEWHHDRI